MTDFQIYALIGLVAYFGAMIFIGYMATLKDNHEGYVIGARNVGLIPTVASLASGYRDGSGMVFWVSAGFGIAYGGLWMFLGVALSMIFYIYAGAQIRERAIQNDYVTIGQFLRTEVGPLTEKLSAVIVSIFALLTVALQLNVSGNIFALVLGVESWIGILSVAVVIGFYLYHGGYGSVVKTDVLQFLVIMSIIIFPMILPPTKADFVNYDMFLNADSSIIIGFFIIGLFYAPSSAESWQRVFSAKKNSVVTWGFPLAGLCLIFICFCLIWFGMGIKNVLPDVDPEQAIFYIFTQTGVMHPIFLSYLAIVLIATTMSSLDTYCYSFASTLVKNIVPQDWVEGREKYIRFTRGAMLSALVITSLIAMSIDNVVAYIFAIIPLLYVLTPTYVLTGINVLPQGEHKDRMVVIASGLGVISFIILTLMGVAGDLAYLAIPAFITGAGILTAVGYSRFKKT